MTDIVLYGDLNMMTVAGQEKAFVAIIADTDDDVLLDLSNIIGVSAVGVRMVGFLHSLLAGHGRALTVVASQPDLLRRLDDSGISLLVPIYPSRRAFAFALPPAA